MIKNKLHNTLQMAFPPQQADEYCEGTGQGELNELNQDYSDQFSTIFRSKVCKHELQEIENCPDCYLNAHVKVNLRGKNTRSFGHCPNYYIHRKDLSL